jgi:hypothetical protein
MEVTKELDISFDIFIWCLYFIYTYLALLHSPAGCLKYNAFIMLKGCDGV